MWPFSRMMAKIDIPKGGKTLYAPVLFTDCEKREKRESLEEPDLRAMEIIGCTRMTEIMTEIMDKMVSGASIPVFSLQSFASIESMPIPA